MSLNVGQLWTSTATKPGLYLLQLNVTFVNKQEKKSRAISYWITLSILSRTREWLMRLMKSKFCNEPDGLSCWIIHQREWVPFFQVCYWVICLLGICQERPNICSLYAFFVLSQLRSAQKTTLHKSQWDQRLEPEAHAINDRFWSAAGGQTFI